MSEERGPEEPGEIDFNQCSEEQPTDRGYTEDIGIDITDGGPENEGPHEFSVEANLRVKMAPALGFRGHRPGGGWQAPAARMAALVLPSVAVGAYTGFDLTSPSTTLWGAVALGVLLIGTYLAGRHH